MKLGEALKDQFEAVRKQLETPKPLMGVVIPVINPLPVPSEELRRELRDGLIVVDAPRVSPQQAVSSLDEGQLVGELLEWLHREGFIQPADQPQLVARRYRTLLDVQRAFFDDRDQ